jgi:NDP-sugar pyrophosphorylase family protein
MRSKPARALLLAGGLGTRLLPYTAVLPKPLVPVGDEPVMETLLRQLASHGIRDITVSVGHLAALIETYFGDGARFGVAITYQHESEPLGTAGPLRPLLAGLDPGDAILVVNGDLLTDMDFSAFIDAYEQRRPAIQVGAIRREERVQLGVLRLDDNDQVRGYDEKPLHTYHASMGVYLVSAAAARWLPPAGRFDMPDLILAALAAGESVAAWTHQGIWLDIGRPDDHRRASELVAENPLAFKGKVRAS